MGSDKERLSTLEQSSGDMKQTINAMASDIADIKQKLDELTGAKKALVYITGLAATMIGLFLTWLSTHKGGN